MSSGGICQGKVKMVTNGCKKRPAFKLKQTKTLKFIFLSRTYLAYVLFLTVLPQHGKKKKRKRDIGVLYCSPSMTV